MNAAAIQTQMDMGQITAVQSYIQGESLGNLLWYTVGEMKVKDDELKALFVGAGLPEKWAPLPVRAPDAFRRATTALEQTRIPYGEGRKVNLLVREVANDSKGCVRQMVREVVDSENRRLGYVPVLEWFFDRKTENIDSRTMLGTLLDEEKQALDQLPALYTEARSYHGGQHVRQAIRHILWQTNAVSVRTSGGVYFVPSEHTWAVEGLRTLCKSLRPFAVTDYPTNCHTVPLIDTAEQRDMVAESLAETVKGEAADLLTYLTNARKGDKPVTKTVAEQAVNRMKRLGEMLTAYRELLNDELVGVTATWELAQGQVLAIVDAAN